MVGVVLAPHRLQVRPARLGVEAQVHDRRVEDRRVDADRGGHVDRDRRGVQQLRDVRDAVRRVVGGQAGRAARHVQVDPASEPLPGAEVVGVLPLDHLRMQPDHQLDVLAETAGLVRLDQHVGDGDAVREVPLRAGGVQHDPLLRVQPERRAGTRAVGPAGATEVRIEVRRAGDGRSAPRRKPWSSTASSSIALVPDDQLGPGRAPTIVFEVRLSQPWVNVTDGTPAARARRIIRTSLTTTPAVAVTTTSGFEAPERQPVERIGQQAILGLVPGASQRRRAARRRLWAGQSARRSVLAPLLLLADLARRRQRPVGEEQPQEAGRHVDLPLAVVQRVEREAVARQARRETGGSRPAARRPRRARSAPAAPAAASSAGTSAP